ncbi:relaxase [Herbaspirillum sp. HC18]|nr:relaxase [Herbaspirillum sp. HC18]
MRSLDFLLGSLGLQRTRRPPVTDAGTRQSAHGRTPENVYPPVDPGIPARAIEEVLNAHQDLIDRIKVCYGMDRTRFEQEPLRLIHRYAEFVHLLPATPDNYFNTPGGLLRMGLEIAFFSLQGTDGHIFSGRATITTRRHLEPRWRLATFIAGLCAEIHRTLCHVIVTNEHGDEWQPYLLPLSSWLARHQVARYFLKWRPNVHETRTLGLFALPHVIPSEMLQALAADNAVIVPHMLASISGMPLYREHNILDDLVRRSAALVIDRYLQASADRYGTPQLGSHLERYLVDALRRLVSSDAAWRPNAERSRVWFGSDGLFIIWPNAAADIRHLLESDQLPGIPKAPETMLEILLAAGVFEAKDASQPTWQILPPEAKAVLDAVKLSSSAILLAGIEPTPQPLAIALCRARAAAPPPAATAGCAGQPSDSSTQLSLPMEAERSAQDAAALPPHHADNIASCPPTAIDTLPAQLALVTMAIKLDAPMRLNPVVRDALVQIVDTLNHDGAAIAACTVASGLFIPLTEFERRNIEPSLALRALLEVKMLVQPAESRTPTVTQDFGGQQQVGVLLNPCFIAGLDPASFTTADTGRH